MHKKYIALTIIILAIVVINIKVITRPKPVKITLPSPKPTQAIYCKKQDLQASIMLSPGAGNIYGTLKLTNTGSEACEIAGSNPINIQYDADRNKNIQISYVGQTQSDTFNLPPHQSLYSQVHYPNGPQCSTTTNPVIVSFSYAISSRESIEFKNEDLINPVVVQSCKLATEMTQIQIWNLSNDPITQ